MNHAQWQNLKALFEQLVDQSAEERAAFLAQLGTEHPDLAGELSRLLRAHDARTVVVDHPIADVHSLLAEDSHLLRVGETLMNRFLVKRCIGRGGMGEVYEAEDRYMGRVAIKIIRPEILRNSNSAARFRAEAVAARSITSPFVCRIHEFLTTPAEDSRSELAFITMEFLDGCNLSDRIQQEGPLPSREAERVATQLCAGLQAIHDAGIVHRDLKTRNIMLVERQSSLCPVIMDFGLARLVSKNRPGLSLTEIGTIVGTPEYMAPEQFEGGEVTRAADIYSLGIVLYETVTGTHPFEASTPLGAAIRRARRPPSVCSLQPQLSRRWDRIIQRCLEYEPGCRYQTAADLAMALTDRAAEFRLPLAVARGSNRRYFIFSGVVVVIAALAGIALLKGNHSGSHPAEALRLFNNGVQAIRNGTYLKATHLLESALGYDKNFALAHARLAEAWAELDFQGKAEHEMLLADAPESASGLNREDRTYLNAIRASVTGDFATAIRNYEQILQHLPEQEKVSGYVDLGRVHEKAGDVRESVIYYNKARLAAPSLPIPYLRLATLESRLGKLPEAAKDFAIAKTLYRQGIEDEGVAEVDYQLGVAAIAAGNFDEALQDEQDSLTAARRINSPQLQTRALTRLAVIAYAEDDQSKDATDQCIAYATQAMDIARSNNLRYWDIEARIRIGNDYAGHSKFQLAESYLVPALVDAQQGQLPRLEALANWGLAIEKDLQNEADETMRYANAALPFYTRNGFFQEALSNGLLLARAQEHKGEFQQSLRSALDVLKAIRRSGNRALVSQAEEAVGQAHLRLRDYSAALQSFQSALADSGSNQRQSAFEALHCADVLWRLGRYKEAEDILNELSRRGAVPALAGDIADLRRQILLAKTQPNPLNKENSH